MWLLGACLRWLARGQDARYHSDTCSYCYSTVRGVGCVLGAGDFNGKMVRVVGSVKISRKLKILARLVLNTLWNNWTLFAAGKTQMQRNTS